LLLRPGDSKPRFVFLICLDAVRPDHLGCYGYARNTTPRIDELARGGALFLDAVTQAPWTLPSVATILSSTFPCQHGARRTEGTQVAYGGVPNNFVEILKSQGFETGLFTGGLTLESKIPAPELSDAALNWLKERLDKRCLIVIHHYDTHSPYVATPRCVDEMDPGYQGRFMYRFGDFEMLRKARVGRLAEVLDLTDRELDHIRTLYDCQIMRGDASVGMIADSLRAWDLLDKSMIIVFADHGEEFLEHGSIDHGQTVYEETIRVPLVVYCPSLIHGPVRVEKQAGLIDLAPTILDAVGVEKPAYFEGVSLMPLVSGRFKASGETLRPCGLPTSCLITEAIARRTEKKALRRPPWKLIYDPFFGAVELYNVSTDRFDSDNLIEMEPRIASRLTDTLLTMQRYYPGGWCVAWRGPKGERVAGTVRLNGKMLEVVGHDIYPEIDSETDSLAIAEDWGAVRFATVTGSEWQGVEVRVDRAMDVEIDMRIGGHRPATVRIGRSSNPATLPIHLNAADAVVDRKLLNTLFDDAGVDCAIFWIEPGSEPTAKQKSQTELRRQLKSIGYIEG
jgi:choline-sulfatase